MGTSVSQSSPPTIGWKSVGACYASADVPLDRTATEIWRAAVQQDDSLRTQLGSSLVAACISAASQSLSSEELQRRADELRTSKDNSVIGEFAKQAFLLKASGAYQGDTPAAVLFRQLTNYYVSRDIPGYVGPNYRCETVVQAREFKKSIADFVATKVNAIERQLELTGKPWRDVYRAILQRLRQQ